MKNKLSAILILSQFLNAAPSFSQDMLSPSAASDSSILEKAIDDALSVESPPSSEKAFPSPAKTVMKPVEEKRTAPVSERKKNGLDDVKIDDASVKLAEKPVKKANQTPAKVTILTKDVRTSAPKKITAEEAQFLASLEKKSEDDTKKKMSKAYEPAPVEPQEVKHEGFVVERDSSKIVKKRMSYSDTMNVKVCFSAGLSIVLDEDIQTELQRVIIDDKIFFDAIDFDNHRGVYVKLKQPIPDGKYWESAIRLVRKDNDKAYHITLIGVPCPKTGTNPFPKTLYIKDKHPGISGKNSKLMTPEDTIIELSAGLPRKNVNKIEVYDMVARSGSEWVVFGVQLQLPGKKELNPENYLIRMIDNLQIYQLPSKVDFLSIQSEKASQATGAPTARYKIMVNIDKQYFIENRYLHLMLIDKKDGYYQYVRIDTLPYIIKLRERGFDI